MGGLESFVHRPWTGQSLPHGDSQPGFHDTRIGPTGDQEIARRAGATGVGGRLLLRPAGNLFAMKELGAEKLEAHFGADGLRKIHVGARVIVRNSSRISAQAGSPQTTTRYAQREGLRIIEAGY